MRYYILSGEGEVGTWTGPYDGSQSKARRRQRQEAAGGDRWASVFEMIPETAMFRAHLRCLDTGDMREVPGGSARAAAATLGALGGRAGTGDAKRRPAEQYRQMATRSAAARRQRKEA